jgi:phosphoribosylformylglycinamidine synthase
MTSDSTFRAEVLVTLKRLVNDPEGIEILYGLHNLGYEEVDEVRSGRYFQLVVTAPSPEEANARVVEMCDRLLSNTVIEEYRVIIHEQSAVS